MSAPVGQHHRQRPGRIENSPGEAISPATWRLAWVIAFGAFTAGLDTSLVQVALHTIQADFGVTLGVAQWVSSSYLLALAVSLPACAWLGNRVGTGRLWLAALAAFTVVSVLCAIAPSIGMLIAFRVLQGLVAGLLVPAGQTLLGHAVGPARLGRVMSRLGIAVSLAPALGPVVGGMLLDLLDWRWLFWLNVPIGIVVLLLGVRRVPRERGTKGAPLDWVGFAYVGIGLPLLVYGLTEWGADAAPRFDTVVTPLVLGAIGLTLFIRRSTRQPHPLLDLRLLRRPTYAAANAAMVFAGVLTFGSTLLFPLYFQLARHDGILATGLLTFALGLGTAMALPVSGRLVDTYGGGPVAVLGAIIAAAVTLELVIVGPNQPALLIQVVLLLLGAGTALLAIPLTVAAYASVPPHQLPDAAAQFNIVNRIGGALGAAIFAVTINRGLAHGTTTAFDDAFTWQLGAAALALASAAVVWRVSRQRRPARSHPAELKSTAVPPRPDRGPAHSHEVKAEQFPARARPRAGLGRQRRSQGRP